MKILITVLLTISTALAQLSPEQRRINERAKDLKALNAAHCQEFTGDKRLKCQQFIDNELDAFFKRQAKALVANTVSMADEKVNAQIKEENLVAEYTKLLTIEGAGNRPCTTSKCLIERYNKIIADKAAAECLAKARQEAQDLGLSYSESDSCEQVQAIINEFKAPLNTATNAN